MNINKLVVFVVKEDPDLVLMALFSLSMQGDYFLSSTCHLVLQFSFDRNSILAIGFPK